MEKIKILDKDFTLFIEENKIESVIKKMAKAMSKDLFDKDPLFIGILNGAFMFASDLLKNIDFPCQLGFIKTTSYNGTHTSGAITSLIGLNCDIKGRTVVILEDIADTGLTLESIYNQLLALKPAKINVAALLLKPDVFSKKVKIDYIGMEIPNNFIVGYGLDYNGYGRNLKDIYYLEKDNEQ